ncbi:tetratricopeptide repeat-like superfamily protein [Tanacetum coccineum]
MVMMIRSNSGFFKLIMRGKTPFTFSASLIHSSNAAADYEHTKSIYQKVANLDDALNLFDEASQRRPFPSIIYFNRCCNLLMDERGCKPDVVVHSNIIDSLCKDQMIDDAFKLFKVMVFEQGISPDVITYSSLIDGLLNLGRWEEASKMPQQMLEVGISLDVQAFNILVDAFCKEGKLEEAENVVEIMLERGIVPNIMTYSSLINGYCLRGEMSKARTILDSLMSKDVVPDVFTYSTLLNGYWKNFKIDEAMLLFQEMKEKAARKLFDEMRAKGLKPNECTYRVILEGLYNKNLIEDALSLFHLLGDSKLNSCINVYNILIDGASKCGKLDTSKLLFNGLTDKRLHPNSECPPDNITYNVLLQGYLRNQYYDDIEMLFHEMEGRHYSLDAFTLSLLLDQIAAGSLDAALLELISKLVPKELVGAFST